MPRYIVRIEGVNFNQTMYDTQQISCARGASLAILWAAARVRTVLRLRRDDEIFSGASQAAFTVLGNSDEIAKAIRRALTCEGKELADLRAALKIVGWGGEAAESEGCLPLAHLSFVVDVVEAAGDAPELVSAALAEAEARNRARQFRQLTVKLADYRSATNSPDEVGRILPGEVVIPMPKGSITPRPGREGEDDRSADPALVSKSVATRRFFGSRVRQAFYRRELGNEFWGLQFTDSLEDIASDAPESLPEQLRGKVAVLYADGNGFGRIREEIAGSHPVPWPPALKTFANSVGTQRKEELLRPILHNLKSMLHEVDPDLKKRAAFSEEKEGDALRFETLLWGGDEVIWVAPAWLGFWLVEGFFTLTKGWAIKHGGESHDLTHAVGMVICDRKTPIRQSTAVARELAEQAKKVKAINGDPVNAVQIEVFESADLPEGQLHQYRRRLYPGLADNREGLARAFTLPGEAFIADNSGMSPLIRRFADWQDEAKKRGLPRSQVYRLLQLAARKRAFAGGDAESDVLEAFKEYVTNAGRERTFGDGDQGLRGDARVGPSRKEMNLWANWPDGVAPVDRPLALQLALIAQYWDFAAPFAHEDPPLPPWHKPTGEGKP